MCALWLMAVVLSGVGALAIRCAAWALSIPTRFVVGLGPRVREDPSRPRSVELRWIPTWIAIELRPVAPGARVLAARAAGPIAVVALPFAVAVALMVLLGAPDPDAPLAVDVAPGSPAERGGVRTGDVIVSVQGVPVPNIAALASWTGGRAGTPTDVTVEREGARLELVVVPEEVGGRGRIGVTRTVRFRSIGVWEAAGVVAGLMRAQISSVARLAEPDREVLSGPVAMTRAMGPRSAPERLALAAVFATTWASFSLLFALFVAVGQLRRHVRAPPASDASAPDARPAGDGAEAPSDP